MKDGGRFYTQGRKVLFRFNRRRTRHAAFKTLPGIGLVTKPITYKMLITPETTA